jgi:hypothetical protein
MHHDKENYGTYLRFAVSIAQNDGGQTLSATSSLQEICSIFCNTSPSATSFDQVRDHALDANSIKPPTTSALSHPNRTIAARHQRRKISRCRQHLSICTSTVQPLIIEIKKATKDISIRVALDCQTDRNWKLLREMHDSNSIVIAAESVSDLQYGLEPEIKTCGTRLDLEIF